MWVFNLCYLTCFPHFYNIKILSFFFLNIFSSTVFSPLSGTPVCICHVSQIFFYIVLSHFFLGKFLNLVLFITIFFPSALFCYFTYSSYPIFLLNSCFAFSCSCFILLISLLDFPGGSDGKAFSPQCSRPGFNPWVGKISWRRTWQLTPVFLPGKSHGWRNLVGYSTCCHKESDMTEQLHFHNV